MALFSQSLTFVTKDVTLMIVSFKDKETEKFWTTGISRVIPPDVQKRAYARLQSLNAAKRLDDLRSPPSHFLEALKGDRRGQHSIRVNQQWRICFVWLDDGVHDVECVDYH